MTEDDTLLGATEAPTLVRPTVDALREAREGSTDVDETVLADEEMRTRKGALRALFIALVIYVVSTTAIPEKTTFGWVIIAVYCAAAIVIGTLLALSGTYAYGVRVSTVIGVTVILLALGSCLYFGVIGGPIIVLPTVVYYYGLGDSKARRRWVAGTAIGGHALLTLLAAAGVVRPTGLIPADALAGSVYILVSGFCIATLLGMTYWLSHRSRVSTLQAMSALDRARRELRQRDVLLDEAREDLDRVVAGARAGRLTGRRVDNLRVLNLIGRGAMGEVYRAARVDSEEPVALKVLHPHLAESEGQVTRFLREAQIIGGLKSPYIPTLFGSGTDADGSPYLVMELLEGLDLAADLRLRASLPLGEIDQLVEEACLALHAAHEASVVHRDIKPQNLFLTVKPRVSWKVLDFGVSMIMSNSGTLTQGGAIGTPAYMAPEQALGSSVDRRADVFSLGAVVYRALTGRPAFQGTSGPATVYAALRYQPVRPGELVPVDSDVESVLALALAKKADLRLASAKELAVAWRAARKHELSAELRLRAERLLTAHAWGTDYSVK
ncbi:MAG: serine/threonine protein kinase [Myxococcales bacterium]|nr:serine/threonine protein kinase [Myxococcales bacterium]